MPNQSSFQTEIHFVIKERAANCEIFCVEHQEILSKGQCSISVLDQSNLSTLSTSGLKPNSKHLSGWQTCLVFARRLAFWCRTHVQFPLRRASFPGCRHGDG